MLRFKNYLSEEVLPAAQVKDGSIDLEKPAVRGQINATLASVTAQAAVTPYIVLHRISKALAYFHIIMPKRAYLEGDKGVEVVELKQFGHRMGMTDDGEFVHDVPSKYYLFLSYSSSPSFGVGYGFAANQLQSLGGSYKVAAKVVDEVELQTLLSNAERALAESCADDKARQSQKMAGREHMNIIDLDGSESTKKAKDTSERKKDKKLSADTLDEERKRTSSVADAFMKGQKANQRTLKSHGDSVTYHGNTIAKHVGDEVHVTTAGHAHSPSTRGHINGILSRLGSPKLSVKKGQLHHGDKPVDHNAWIKVKKSTVSEDKDPCWKGYEMIGMKKKGGKPVPNCVPVKEEEQIDEVSAGLAQRAGHHAFVKSDKMKKDAQKEPDMHSYVQAFHKGEKKNKQGIKFIKYAAKKMKEETQIDEVSKRLLGRYIKKAHVSGLGAAAEGEQAYSRKDKEGLHRSNKTGEKREQGIERAVDKMTGSARVHAKEDTATTTGQKRLRVQHKTVVRKALGADKEKKTILVTKKGDPHAASGGGVHRIAKDKYDPSKYNLASE